MYNSTLDRAALPQSRFHSLRVQIPAFSKILNSSKDIESTNQAMQSMRPALGWLGTAQLHS